MISKQSTCVAAALAVATVLPGCAASPDRIKTAYVSPVKFADWDCGEVAVERLAIEDRAAELYRSLDKRADLDAAKMGVGVVLFLPTLFFLKGDGAEAAEFAEMKGQYKALRYRSEQLGCELPFHDLDKSGAKQIARLQSRN